MQNLPTPMDDAFHLIKNHLDMLGNQHRLKFLLLTSSMANEGTLEISRGLAKHFAQEHESVLLLQQKKTKDLRGKKKISSFVQLTEILNSEKLASGLVKDFGLLDLFLLLNLQRRSGDLSLRTQTGKEFIAEFCEGQLCSFKTAQYDLRTNLKWCTLKNATLIDPLQKKSLKSKTPLLITVLAAFPSARTEILASFKDEILKLFEQISHESLWDFEFIPANKALFAPIVKEFPEFMLSEIPLEERHFISRLTQEASRQTDGFCTLSIDLAGIKKLQRAGLVPQMLSLLAKQFDRILIESERYEKKFIKSFENCTDGSVLVVRKNFAPARKIQRVTNKLRDMRMPLLGAVLNEEDGVLLRRNLINNGS